MSINPYIEYVGWIESYYRQDIARQLMEKRNASQGNQEIGNQALQDRGGSDGEGEGDQRNQGQGGGVNKSTK